MSHAIKVEFVYSGIDRADIIGSRCVYISYNQSIEKFGDNAGYKEIFPVIRSEVQK